MTTSDRAIVRQGMDLIDRMDADELSELVDYIREVFKSKRSLDAARKRTQIRVGTTRVRISNKIKPIYLQGQTGTITKMRDTRVEVTLDRGPQGKFRSGVVVCNPSTFDIIED